MQPEGAVSRRAVNVLRWPPGGAAVPTAVAAGKIADRPTTECNPHRRCNRKVRFRVGRSTRCVGRRTALRYTPNGRYGSEVHLHQQAGGVLVGGADDVLAHKTAVFNPVLVLPVVVLDAHVQLLGTQVQRLAQVVLDLRVEVQVVAVIVFVAHHPLDEAVDDQVGVAYRQGVAPHRGDLPQAFVIAFDAAIGVTTVEVQLEVVGAGNGQVEARADQLVLDVAFAELVGGGQQHVGHRAGGQAGAGQLAEGQARGEFAVVV